MKKVLLSAAALAVLSAPAFAAESPVNVSLGGSVDFQAALFDATTKRDVNGANARRRQGDFSTIYDLNIAAEGEASGVEYGALINLSNGPWTSSATQAQMDEAYVWVASEYGKLVLGDVVGPTSLMVYAPTVGLGQFSGDYLSYISTMNVVYFTPEHNTIERMRPTKAVYYTPRFSMGGHNLQLGVSYTSKNFDRGSDVALYNTRMNYKNEVQAVARYEGQFDDVKATVTPMIVVSEHGRGAKTDISEGERPYTAWGVGSHLSYADFTLGGSYVNSGHYRTATGQDKAQEAISFGLSYDGFEDIELAVNYLTGNGYRNLAGDRKYFDRLNMIGAGATYQWAPGMRTALDVMFYDQREDETGFNVMGNIFTISQKMSF